jgi:molecular chaperone DnaK
MIHSVRKSLTEYGDKVSADEKAAIEGAIKEAEEALKSDDKAAIEAKTQALAQASHKLAEQMYKDQQAQGQPAGEGGAGPQGGSSSAGARQDDGNVVDAEFEEVKDKK